jgi:hypothetical protein
VSQLSPACCWCFGRPTRLRRCCRWTCCAFLFSPCRSHLDCLFLRADAGFCGNAFLSREPFRIFGGADRTPDHALANRRRLRGAACRPIGRALSGRTFGRHRAPAVRLGPWLIGVIAGLSLSSRRDMADGAGGRGVRFVPDSQQPHHDRSRSARAERRCERQAWDGAALRRTLALSRARCSPFVHHPPPTFGPSPSPTPELQ